MTTRRYYFTNDSCWASNGCDCCEDDYMECYNLDNSEHPNIVQNGSALSIDRCMEQVLEWEGVIDDQRQWLEVNGVDNWEEEWQCLASMMEDSNLQVIIQHDDDNCEVFP